MQHSLRARSEVMERLAKTIPVDFFLHDWLIEFVTPEQRLQDPDGPLFRNPDGRQGGW